MRNRRSVFEENKEKFLRNNYFSKGNYVVPTKSYIESQSRGKTHLLDNSDQFHEYSSASSSEKENSIRYNIVSDLETILNRLSIEADSIKNNHRSYINAFESMRSKFKEFELNANRQLLLYLNDDPFTYGVTDKFETYDFVDFSRSTTRMLADKITLGAQSFSDEPLNIRSIETRVYSPDSVVSSMELLSNDSNIKFKDGSNFKVRATSSNASATMKLEVVIFLEEEANINELQVVSRAIESNAKESISIYYSKDNSQYVQPDNHDLVRSESSINNFSIFDTDIKSIKVIFTKHAYDRVYANQYEYFFSIDYIGKINYVYDDRSTFYSKAYEIVDEDGNPVNFSMATLKVGTCCTLPDGTAISFYLSKDNENYYPASYFEEANSIVEFNNTIDRDIFQRYDASATSDLISIDNEIYLNNYIPSGTSIIDGTLVIKRNINSWERVSSTLPGNRYKATIEIDALEGRYIDLGDTSCKINGTSRSGLVFLPKGRYEIETSQYEVLPSGISKEVGLRLLDSLYPYNHKYLFEGYSYPPSFEGEMIYSGVDIVYEKYLTKVNRSFFDLNTNRRDIYTLVEREQGTFIKVHRGAITGNEEIFLDARINDNNIDNKVYVKAIMTSTSGTAMPKIDSIQVRVV